MDDHIRISAFKWLEEQVDLHGDVLPRNILEQGFNYNGQRVTLLGPRGIWKPKIMKSPISITTILDGPYPDALAKDGFLKYRYRGNDPLHPDNVGLRKLMNNRTPLIYFFNLVKGKYLPSWPVYILHDDPKNLTFSIAVDDISSITQENNSLESPWEINESSAIYYRRTYATANTRVRLHQRSFRERVLSAYNNQCTLCKLKHIELLDAAHITADSDVEGFPIVQNGLSLCKIHHAAFDSNILGISPDYIVHVREDILREIDGPMLKYGIQSMNKNKIILPRNKVLWPDKERLERRFEMYRKAG
ncbi:HNH endonuclease [Bacteroidota bacterium]